MKKIIYLFAASAMMLTACGSDDESPNNTIDPPQYGGPWQLVNVNGGFAGISDDIEDVIWNFNEDENSVTVTNNNPDDTDEDFFASGTYSVTFQEDEDAQDCNYNVKIQTTDFGCIDIDGNTMTFTQQFVDGYVLTFERVPVID